MKWMVCKAMRNCSRMLNDAFYSRYQRGLIHGKRPDKAAEGLEMVGNESVIIAASESRLGRRYGYGNKVATLVNVGLIGTK